MQDCMKTSQIMPSISSRNLASLEGGRSWRSWPKLYMGVSFEAIQEGELARLSRKARFQIFLLIWRKSSSFDNASRLIL